MAAWIVDRTLASGRPVDDLLGRAGDNLEAADRGLLRELVLGTLRWLRRLDAILESASRRRIEDIDAPLRAPLRLAVYQLLFLDRIPAHAAVNEAVAEAQRRTHRGAAGFVNAVLRRVAKEPHLESWPVREEDPLRRLAIEHSHPDWLVGRWWQSLGVDRTRALLEANNRIKPPQILTFKGRQGREPMASALLAAGIETRPSQLAPRGLIVTSGQPRTSSQLRQGQIYLQDVASQAAALIPPPVAGEHVVDLAAAPGGKTFSLFAWEPDLQVVAIDRSRPRLELLRANRDRLGLPIELVQADAVAPPLRPVFDRVVLDVPCTGTGTLRKHPELKWRLAAGELARLAAQGLALLAAGSRLARPGGLVSFITCSIEPEENREVVARFLRDARDFELVPLEDQIPASLTVGVVGTGCWQVLPEGPHDGFTVHVLRRRA